MRSTQRPIPSVISLFQKQDDLIVDLEYRKRAVGLLRVESTVPMYVNQTANGVSAVVLISSRIRMLYTDLNFWYVNFVLRLNQ